MKNKTNIFLLGLLVIWGSWPAQAERKSWARRPGIVLYSLKPEATALQRTSLARTLGVHASAASVSSLSTRTRHAVAVPAQGRDEEELADALLRTGAVAYAEPDYLMPPAVLPNDPGYSAQWHHSIIQTPVSWDTTTGNPSVLVAVCDSGVDSAHADLSANLSLPGYNAADQSTLTDPRTDHGTAVAGLIDAAGNNGLGGVGVAWNVKVLPVRVTNFIDGSAWCSDMASGIEWAADHGAKVINLSYHITGCPQAINAAAQYAKEKGAVTFVAAGNEGQNLTAPFPPEHAFILVGATDSSDHRAAFSNYGASVDLMAPGVSIYSTVPGSSYAYATGTSFSAPISAGVAALLFSLNPSWSPDEIRTLLLATAQPVGALNGYGRVDAASAVRAANSVLAGGAMPLLSSRPGSGSRAGVSNLDSTGVYPNPWRSDQHAGVSMLFQPLTEGSTVKIFTISGFLVRTLTPVGGNGVWDLKNSSDEQVAAGVYLYSVTDPHGNESQGKLAVIR